MFDHLGNLVVRHWAWVLGSWILLVALVGYFAPDWDKISQDDDVRSFPPDYDSVVALDLRKHAFPQDAFNSDVVVVIERRDGELSDLDFQFVETLAARLARVQREGELRDLNGNIIEDRHGLHEFFSHGSAKMGQLLVSKDKKATLLYAGCDHTFMAEKIVGTVEALRTEINVMRNGGEVPIGIEVAVTGSAGVGADLHIAQTKSLKRSLWVTIVLVITILLLVYRSPVVALNPLATISVSVVTAMSLMALATEVNWGGFHFQVMKITEIFVIVVLFGAGTDYCLFLIARYREELQRGHDRETALRLAIHNVGGALAASAATVVVGLGMMVFADFGKFRYTGPAVAISLAVALVGALTLTPAMLRMLGSIVFWPFTIRPANQHSLNNDDNPAPQNLPQRFWESFSHWLVLRPATIWAACVLVLAPFAVWGFQLVPTYDFLSELSDTTESKVGSAMIQRDGHFPKGTLGRLTLLLKTPDGAPNDLRLPEARKDFAELTERLVNGGSQPAEFYSPELISQVMSLTSPLGKPLPLVQEKTVVEDKKPVVEKKQPAVEEKKSARKLSALGSVFEGIKKGVAQATKSVSETEVGERARQAFEQGWKDATDHYVSTAADGQVARVEVVFNVAPFSKESMKLRDDIDRLVRDFTKQPGSTLSGATHSFAGITATTFDLEKITQSDQSRINRLVVVAVYMILVVLLRRPFVCVYLMITVLLGYYATLGITEGVFWTLHHWSQPDLPWLGLDWKVSFFLFIILVAVGEDYNILLMSRVMEEERKRGEVEGVRTAVARTGGIITSCGIIMAGTFGSMATGTLSAVQQLGFALALGVLLDTFVVRPILVPTFLLMTYSVRQRFRKQPMVAAPHVVTRPQRETAGEPVGTAERRGLLAFLLAWLGRSM